MASPNLNTIKILNSKLQLSFISTKLTRNFHGKRDDCKYLISGSIGLAIPSDVDSALVLEDSVRLQYSH